jgi:hypothetical protein
MEILRLIGHAVKLAGKIIDAVAEEGDGAADKRLKDFDGWDELKDEILNHPEAVRRFKKKLEDL